MTSRFTSSACTSEPASNADGRGIDTASLLRQADDEEPVGHNAKSTHLESEARWQLHYGFRSILLGLLCISSSSTAGMLLVPGIYSGCDAASLGLVPILTVLILIPAFMFGVNRWCHKAHISHRNSKRFFVPLILGYYLPIVYFDSQMHAMECSNSWDCNTWDCTPQATSCVPTIDTTPSHVSDTMMLVDVAANFFISACLLEAWRARALHALCHATLWACDNSTYPHFTSTGTKAQRLWHWAGFLVVEAQTMATIIAIAFAIDVMWESQAAQARLEVRVAQIENEKERLAWDAKLRDAKLRQHSREIENERWTEPWRGVESRSADLSNGSARSHHTSKLGGCNPWAT